jgi:hypothetical protein
VLQGRLVSPSLRVDEPLRLVAIHPREVARVYTIFPRLAVRKGNGGAQLSGGEQQMLAIGRALLLEPKLLVMDEPTEGLAPVIVEQVALALRDLARDSDIAVLLIEQNLGVAIEVADRIGVMVNGRLAMQMPAAELAADRDLQERLLGVRAGAGVDDEAEAPPAPEPATGAIAQVYTVRRAFAEGAPTLDAPAPRSSVGLNRWNAGDVSATLAPVSRAAAAPAPIPVAAAPSAQLFDFPVAAGSDRAAYVAGTFDT